MKNKISNNDKEILINKISTFCSEELEIEISRFEVEFLFIFLSKEMGTYFYNQGLKDAQAILSTKLDIIIEAISEIEKPVN
ncbi:MAG: DUF2164 domain-containing protein [Candidatus Marinimicrobia bacterium]|jgi:uncharacterized protein (DUF2164 family)|nr:DUF2164 domain-containing protein [Candidatus Neomarinimicrobiota bacterium]MBT3500873.1 DUF2164 domain-containing protein [Candidatus Neomarinimicrobiota bacterium]MBT3838907.1 DUF2164 domain-containing protein [Candidatus Neomarinimicrobiota bacterium]MBT4000332.1 DUF2164 domain-containing protein [Candidatus Neomarinimicrobiota bacterium]MBT4282682.1 DUF2164 domain-containing protein [Candidatus Neomarinimicrobiota bacterium]